MGDCARRGLDDWTCKGVVRELCHLAAPWFCPAMDAKGREAREAESGALQLSCGKRNRGSMSAAMTVGGAILPAAIE